VRVNRFFSPVEQSRKFGLRIEHYSRTKGVIRMLEAKPHRKQAPGCEPLLDAVSCKRPGGSEVGCNASVLTASLSDLQMRRVET
jgi:hypothetical protein